MSSLVPRYEELRGVPTSYDPLKVLVREADRLGISVHLWFNVFYTWSQAPFPPSPRHLVYTHRDWFVADKHLRSILLYPVHELESKNLSGYFISPACEDAVLFLRSVLGELLRRYPSVKGVHLDYIRYLTGAFGMELPMRTRFYRRYYVDPGVREDIWSDEEWAGIMKLWREERIRVVSEVVKGFREEIELVNPKLVLSCAVFPNVEYARKEYGQDWATWVDSGWVDFVVPMVYSPSTGYVVSTVSKIGKLVPLSKVVVGLGGYKQSPSQVGEKVKRIRNMGVRGIAVFSYGGVKDRGDNLLEYKEWLSYP